METYQLKKRHLVVGGKSTTLSIERFYWSAIDRIAAVKGYRPSKLLALVIALKPPNYKSRAGWVRLWVTIKCWSGLPNKREAVASVPDSMVDLAGPAHADNPLPGNRVSEAPAAVNSTS